MNTLINSNTILSEFSNFIQKGSIELYSPFISYDTLVFIYDLNPQIKKIIVRWRLEDFRANVADLRLYDFCEERDIDLYMSSQIHMKAVLRNQKDVFFGSANFTSLGLNKNAGDQYNFELSYIKNDLSFNDLLYFQQVEYASIFVTKKIVEKIAEEIDNVTLYEPTVPYLEIESEKFFYTSQFPLTKEPKFLYEFYSGARNNADSMEYKMALHDLGIYKVHRASNLEEFLNELYNSFKNHPFIVNLIGHVEQEGYIYFGRLKQWVQDNCLDTPVPHRRELTELVQIFYHWIEVLGQDDFIVDRPNHSQRIKVLM